MDSTMWNDFAFRDDDIVIATYGKTGTTWVQQIVAQLIFRGIEGIPVSELSPWLDLRVPPKHIKLPAVEQQTHRRFLKTHLPVDALVFSPKAKYLYVARDGRDVVWSLYNHHTRANAAWYEALNDTPGLVGPPIGKPPESVRSYFHDWLKRDGYPFWAFWENVVSWWSIHDLPNVMLLHYSRLKEDLPGQIGRIAEYLGITIAAQDWPAILEHSGFAYMKAHAEETAPLGGMFWEGGAQSFIHKGTNARWRDVLTGEDIAYYEGMAREKLGEACAHWLATGELPAE
ncbi:MAG: sulfotransferase domain-containing protein [Rhizomicrobium sp.]